MTCPHTETFDCHGNKRCSACYVDSFVLHDGTLVWPSQDAPSEWDTERVAQWFLDNQIYRLPQGCEGFEFCRNNTAKPSTYGYVWVEVTLDLDYMMAYLLDVRRHDGTDETRQFIMVAFGGWRENQHIATHNFTATPFAQTGTDGPRLLDGLHWFAEQVDVWLTKEKA